MKPVDSKSFTEILTAMATVYNSSMDGNQIKLWFKLLEPVDIEVFEIVAMEYMKSDAAFMPRPGQIYTLVMKKDGRPEPEEAWNLVSFSEDDTNVWTQEMEKAYWAAFEAGSNGERIAARMAFLEVYKREVANARNTGKRIKWSISLGQNKIGRIVSVNKALGLGHINQGHAKNMLPGITEEEISKGTLLPASKEVLKLIAQK